MSSIYLVLIVISLVQARARCRAGSTLMTLTLTGMPPWIRNASASTSLSVDFIGETTSHESQMIGLLI
jgi:hypothetical protein